MKVGVITCHKVYNYGASLQSYALQHYLKKKGIKAYLINYLPDLFRSKYNLFFVREDRRKIVTKFPILKLLMPLSNRQMLITWGRKKAFNKFDTEHIDLSPSSYSSIDELKKNPPVADIYITGSDQVWNTDMSNGRDASYFLDFGDEKIKRISYADSFGISNIKEEYKAPIKEWLKRFKAISVREKTGLNILASMGYTNNCTNVIDPVFLLSKDEWANLSQNHIHRKLEKIPYILVYDFYHNDIKVKKIVEKIAKEKNLKIVSINDTKRLSYANININNAGPLDFVWLIHHATTVVSTSFHATAFSIIFQKDFYSYTLLTQKNASRMSDLLDLCQIKNRLNINPHEINAFIQWEDVKSRINDQIKKSKQFLHDNIK